MRGQIVVPVLLRRGEGCFDVCHKPQGQYLTNWTFDCGTQYWSFDPAYTADITDNGDGSVHLKTTSNFGSLVPDTLPTESGDWIVEIKIRNQTGNGKISFRKPNNVWVSTPTLGDGVHTATYSGVIKELHVGADGDPAYEADYEYISLRKTTSDIVTYHGDNIIYKGKVLTMADLFDILTFDYDEVENVDITTTDPDWTDILNMDTPDREAGVYGAVFSLQFHLNSTSQSFIYRFSMDGGATWGPEYLKEVKDRSNTEVIEVMNVLDHTGGPIELAVQVTREGGADCTVLKAFVSAERKGII